jgi:hypothetical protein
MLANAEKDENLNNIMDYWYKFEVTGPKLPRLYFLNKFISIRFPLPSKLLTIATVLPASTTLCERDFCVTDTVKTSLEHQCRQAALMF